MSSPPNDPGKQGLEAVPSSTCRGHLESGPGPGSGNKNVAGALNKGSQQGQPGKSYQHHCDHASKTGPRKELEGTVSDRGPQGPRTWRRLDSQGRTGSLPPPWPGSKSQLRERGGAGETQPKRHHCRPSVCSILHAVTAHFSPPGRPHAPILQKGKPRLAEALACSRARS